MRPRRIFFINRFYWPEEPATAQLLTDLATFLAARGHAVTVVTSRPPQIEAPASEVRDGVAIERVRTTRWGRRSLRGRAVDFATFYPAAFWRLLRLARRGDLLVALTDPPLIGVIGWLAARLRGARVAHWVQDIYPEIAIQITRHRWPVLLRPLRNLAWRQAVACVMPGHDMARTVRDAGLDSERVIVAPNWAPAGVAPPVESQVAELRHAWGLDGKFIVAYSGNLGRVHDLDPLLEVATALRDDPRIVFLFIGHGARRESLERAARDRALANVVFRPPQPREQLAASLGLGDIHCVTLLPGAERFVFPSKLYGIAQVGRPVLFIGARESELAGLIKAHELGAIFSRSDTGAIADFLRQLPHNPGQLARFRHAARAFQPHGLADATAVWDRLMRDELAARPDSL